MLHEIIKNKRASPGESDLVFYIIFFTCCYSSLKMNRIHLKFANYFAFNFIITIEIRFTDDRNTNIFLHKYFI